jgi:hypothetical protein
MVYLLNEAIEDIKKYYPNIPDDVFMQLIELDPTYRPGSSSAGKYSKWLLNLYNKGNLSENDFNEVTPLLNQFTTYRNRIQNKDLNSYKSLDALADTLTSVIDDDSMLTPRQKVRFLKNVKSGKIKTAAEDDYDVVLETPKFIVYVPNTHEASMMLGKGTEWCTAHENPEWYNKYTEDGGKLYIIKNKRTGERWQYSDLQGDFLNQYDDDFNIAELLQQDDKLYKFITKLTNIDFINFDGTLIYNGKWFPGDIIDDITNVIISNGVTEIARHAFDGCNNLINVTIPNSVTEIGVYAFNDCYSLTSINIPNSVTKIGEGAFENCRSLTSIIIPNSVTDIEESTFLSCSCLKSVIIPDSVTHIYNNAFDFCSNLTIYTNNAYALKMCKHWGYRVKHLSSNESYKKPYKLHIREY